MVQTQDWSEAWKWPRKKVKGGGNAFVWKATDPMGSTSVALKWNRVPSRDETYNRKLALVEEEVLRSCQHLNLVKLLDAKKERGRYLLMLEWIDGRSLDQFSKWDLSLVDSLNIVRAVGAALDALHAKGYVHGDISTGNIIRVEPPVYAKVIDLSFRNLDGRMCGYFPYANGGTEGFKAPEKEDKHAAIVDRRVDIYSLGKVLDVLTRGIVSRAHALHGPRIDQVVARACTYYPHDRYPDISTMLAALPSP